MKVLSILNSIVVVAAMDSTTNDAQSSASTGDGTSNDEAVIAGGGDGIRNAETSAAVVASTGDGTVVAGAPGSVRVELRTGSQVNASQQSGAGDGEDGGGGHQGDPMHQGTELIGSPHADAVHGQDCQDASDPLVASFIDSLEDGSEGAAKKSDASTQTALTAGSTRSRTTWPDYANLTPARGGLRFRPQQSGKRLFKSKTTAKETIFEPRSTAFYS